jgi:hypothetical protein
MFVSSDARRTLGDHPHFSKQETDAMEEQAETRIWKYMDLAKFLALLTTESLYFPSPSRLQDPFEKPGTDGTFPLKIESRLP